MSIEAMKQALEVLEESLPDVQECITDKRIASHQEQIAKHEAAIYALRNALAQTEQEPVAWGIANTRPTEKNPLMMVMLDEPKPSHLVVPLYTAPPKREWSGLSVSKAEELLGEFENDPYEMLFALDKYLREKNA